MKVENKSYFRKNRAKTVIITIAVFCVVIFLAAAVAVQLWYKNQLMPASQSTNVVSFSIIKGQSPKEIANNLQNNKIIRNSQAFQWYLRQNKLIGGIQAGHYELDSSKTTQDIAKSITSGDVAVKAFTILPGKRIDQIKQQFVAAGYQQTDIDYALDPGTYKNHPALVNKPTAQNLEGFLYPETFNVDTTTKPSQIVSQSLDQMARVVTPDMIDAFQKNGLTEYQAIILASIVEKEASGETDKQDIAAVFYNRLKKGINLQSDVTYHYGAVLMGVPPTNSLQSPYNTYLVKGLPPGPISNVTKTTLQAVASPSNNDYLFFVAGDDGKTYFAKTVEEHNALVKQYCIKKCSTF